MCKFGQPRLPATVTATSHRHSYQLQLQSQLLLLLLLLLLLYLRLRLRLRLRLGLQPVLRTEMYFQVGPNPRGQTGTDPVLCYAFVKAFDVIKLTSTRFELYFNCLQVASLRCN